MKLFEIIRRAMTASITMRVTLVLYMMIYISIAHLTEYLDCFDASKIELTEEKEMDTEEKESEEEVKKSFLTSRSMSYEFLLKNKFNSTHKIYWFWKSTVRDIPTPPPKV